MLVKLQQLAGKLSAKPRTLFLADGIGALITAFLLAVILANFEVIFGMPRRVLYFLSLVACVFAVYSLNCSFFNVRNWWPYLRVIIAANLGYCLVTAGLLFYYRQKLTFWGFTYFVLEIIVVGLLVTIEIMTLTKR
ncbi:MAG: hypothetical protein JNK14_13250 [Chitinophagaceae bacterium]|nr:hypothetical protein [Chitinophagaceae bacterium]